MVVDTADPLVSTTSETIYSIYAPIATIIPGFNAETISDLQLRFLWRILRETLDTCVRGDYSFFDGHTASTCCHGVALLALELLKSISSNDAKDYIKFFFPSDSRLAQNNAKTEIPNTLILLSRLYILQMAKVPNFSKGYITDLEELKKYGLSNRFLSRMVKSLQKNIANLVSCRNSLYFEQLPLSTKIHGIPASIWGQYVSKSHTRYSPSSGISYSSNLFSMRGTMAYLSHKRYLIALIIDVIDENSLPQDRYISIYEGNGHGHFICLFSPTKNFPLSSLPRNVPVFALGGVAQPSNIDIEDYHLNIHKWENNLLELVLACDIWYPQFPVVSTDSTFDSSPIVPEESSIRSLIDTWSLVDGVQAHNPAICCLTHIYPTSCGEIIDEIQENTLSLPRSFIPHKKSVEPLVPISK